MKIVAKSELGPQKYFDVAFVDKWGRRLMCYAKEGCPKNHEGVNEADGPNEEVVPPVGGDGSPL